MPFTLRPSRRFPVQCAVRYNAGLITGGWSLLQASKRACFDFEYRLTSNSDPGNGYESKEGFRHGRTARLQRVMPNAVIAQGRLPRRARSLLTPYGSASPIASPRAMSLGW